MEFNNKKSAPQKHKSKSYGNKKRIPNETKKLYDDRKPYGEKNFGKPNFVKNSAFNNSNDSKLYGSATDKPNKKKYQSQRPLKTPPIHIKPTVVKEQNQNENVVCGRNAVLELLKSNRPIDKIFVQKNQKEGSLTVIVSEAVRSGITVVEAEKAKLDKLNFGASHQGVIAYASEKEYCSVDDILEIARQKNEKPFIIIADKIMDPHNLGAIIRTAECAGAHGLIIPKRHAVGISSVVSKSSAGAIEHLAISKVANLTNIIEHLKEEGIWIFASCTSTNDDNKTIAMPNTDNVDESNKPDKEIKPFGEMNYNLPCALIIGNEGEGISPILLNKSDFLINIPMFGKISSLNVSCAAAVLMYKIKESRTI